MHSFKIIGLGGTNGSGKDTVGQILAEQHGYLFISVTDLLRTEAQRRNQPVEREVLREISAEWRRELGLGVLVDKAVAQFETVKDQYQGVVMASIRNPGEADRIHEMNGTMVWVDADPQTRYDRIQRNKAERGRAEEDNKTFEQFLSEEAAEMHTPEGGDAANLNSSGVKDLSDVFIENNGADTSSLETAITQIITT
ncbi:MAG: AAA family ATPase [Patescibacteria group bacterium]|nr:AAA family ATPase [Patescibacteria group bacterium]